MDVSSFFFLCSQIQNLGIFSVDNVLFRADIWAVTLQGNQLVNITDYSINQVTRSQGGDLMSLFTPGFESSAGPRQSGPRQ